MPAEYDFMDFTFRFVKPALHSTQLIFVREVVLKIPEPIVETNNSVDEINSISVKFKFVKPVFIGFQDFPLSVERKTPESQTVM